jgi:Rrf2 family protein
VSTRGDYASRALLSLALHGATTTPTSVRDIADRTGLPQPYLEQILLALKGAGLVRSKRGVGGGYVLARDPADITLAQVVSAVDGPIVVGDFGEPHENGACDHEGQCVLLAVWAEVGATMRSYLQSFTLADMVERARGTRPGAGTTERPRPERPTPERPRPERQPDTARNAERRTTERPRPERQPDTSPSTMASGPGLQRAREPLAVSGSGAVCGP